MSKNIQDMLSDYTESNDNDISQENESLINKSSILLLNKKRKKKVFRIKKYIKQDRFKNELCDEELSEDEIEMLKNKKYSPYSKVNFSKLTSKDKLRRFENIVKVIKKLKEKIRNLESDVPSNCPKILDSILCNKLNKKKEKDKYLFDFELLANVLKKFHENRKKFNFEDERNFLINLIEILSLDKTDLNNIHIKRIFSFVRSFLPSEAIMCISDDNRLIKSNVNGTKQIFISKDEFIQCNSDRQLISCVYNGEILENKATESQIDKPNLCIKKTNNNNNLCYSINAHEDLSRNFQYLQANALRIMEELLGTQNDAVKNGIVSIEKVIKIFKQT